MSKLDYPKRAAGLFSKTKVAVKADTRAAMAAIVPLPPPIAQTRKEAVNAHVNAQKAVNAQAVNAQNGRKGRSGSKHPPGYMTQYMRDYRARTKT